MRATLSNVLTIDSRASNQLFMSHNVARRGCIIFNDSTSTLYVKFGINSSLSSFSYKISSGDTLEFPQPVHEGDVSGIWDSPNGYARITELYEGRV